jgi:hypothetical protein
MAAVNFGQERREREKKRAQKTAEKELRRRERALARQDAHVGHESQIDPTAEPV